MIGNESRQGNESVFASLRRDEWGGESCEWIRADDVSGRCVDFLQGHGVNPLGKGGVVVVGKSVAYDIGDGEARKLPLKIPCQIRSAWVTVRVGSNFDLSPPVAHIRELEVDG